MAEVKLAEAVKDKLKSDEAKHFAEMMVTTHEGERRAQKLAEDKGSRSRPTSTTLTRRRWTHHERQGRRRAYMDIWSRTM